MRDTGMGRKKDYLRRGIDDLVDKLDSETDEEELANLINRHGKPTGPIDGSPEVRDAVARAIPRVNDVKLLRPDIREYWDIRGY